MIFDWKKVLAGDINRTRFVERYGSFPHIHKENVAEHSYYVSLYAYLLYVETGCVADLGTILTRAMFHDIEESMTGDMLRAVKYSSDKMHEAMEEAGESLLTNLVNDVAHITMKGTYTWEGVREDILSAWRNAKAYDLEGVIVSIADLLCVVSYTHIESQFGNHHANRIRMEITEHLARVKDGIEVHSAYVPDHARNRLRQILNDVIATI